MSFLGDLSPQQGLINMGNNLAQNSAMNQGTMYAAQQQQNDLAAQQAMLANLYGPQGFGGQTAQYAGAGAAYGRATGGFGGYGGNNDIYGVGNPSGSVERGPDLPDVGPMANGMHLYGTLPGEYGYGTQQSWIQQQAMDPGSSWYDPTYAASRGGGVAQQPTWNTDAGSWNPAPAQDWSTYFTQLTNPAKDAAPDPSSGGGGAFSGGSIYGGRTPAGMPDYMKLLGYTPDASLGWQSQAPAYTPPPAAQYFSQQPQAPYQDYGAGMHMYGTMPGEFGYGAQQSWIQQQAMDPGSSWYDPTFADRFGMGFDPNSFANRFAAGGYYQPGTPSQISGYAPNGYDPLSGQAPPYTYKPGFVQGPGGPGDWVPQQIPGMNTLSPNDMTYRNPSWNTDSGSWNPDSYFNVGG